MDSLHFDFVLERPSRSLALVEAFPARYHCLSDHKNDFVAEMSDIVGVVVDSFDFPTKKCINSIKCQQ